MAPRQKYPSQTADKFIVRLPNGLRDRVKAAAARNNRTMNAEIVTVLEASHPEPVEPVTPATADLLKALQALVASLIDQDDEGMIEHAPQMEAARAAIARATTP